MDSVSSAISDVIIPTTPSIDEPSSVMNSFHFLIVQEIYNSYSDSVIILDDDGREPDFSIVYNFEEFTQIYIPDFHLDSSEVNKTILPGITTDDTEIEIQLGSSSLPYGAITITPRHHTYYDSEEADVVKKYIYSVIINSSGIFKFPPSLPESWGTVEIPSSRPWDIFEIPSTFPLKGFLSFVIFLMAIVVIWAKLFYEMGLFTIVKTSIKRRQRRRMLRRVYTDNKSDSS